MVEVFKTNVKQHHDAEYLVRLIHDSFVDYCANFDLHDCDNILRVKSKTGSVHAAGLVSLLQRCGFDAQVLPDEVNLLVM
jgi:hypothetical protein